MFARLFKLLFKRKVSSNADVVLQVEAKAEINAPFEIPMEPLPSLPESATAEELCELMDGMTHDEVRAQLSKLYRRHNRAASSLNPELRKQAERMLDAIVEARHRYLDFNSERS